MTSPNFSPKKRAFLAAYAECGNVTQAALIAKVSRRSHVDWMKDPAYVEAFRAAEDQAADALEKEARRRAIEGVDEPVFYKGDECGTVRKYSDTLLIFLLKGIRPEKYRENIRQEVVGEDGGPVQVELTTSELLRKVAEIGAKVGIDAKGESPCSTPS